MEEHDEFELAIEMRKHGALAASAGAALDTHLATCASCRHYATLADESDARLASFAISANAKIDWTRQSVRLARLRRASGTRDLLPLVLALVAFVLAGSVHYHQPLLLVGEACAALVLVPAFMLFTRAHLAHAERIDPLAFYRRRLDAKLWRERLLVGFFSFLALFTYWLSGGHEADHAYHVAFWPTHSWQHLRGSDVVMLVTSIASWHAAMRVLFVRLPETRRERADLA